MRIYLTRQNPSWMSSAAKSVAGVVGSLKGIRGLDLKIEYVSTLYKIFNIKLNNLAPSYRSRRKRKLL